VRIDSDGSGKVSGVLVRTRGGVEKISTDFVFMGLGEIPNSDMQWMHWSRDWAR